MANLEFRDGDGSEKFLKATGTGATGDPFIVEHKETSAAAIAVSAASIDTKTPALGQALAAASVPVVLTAAQMSTLTPPAAITGFATSALQSSTETLVGAVTETAPATDTASSGLNGRLQRIAQRITSLIALIPAALTGSGNFKVAVQEALPAGTAAIGKLAANSGVDIGDVDITSIAAGDNNIGNVDIVTVPSDPFGANADAAATAGGTGTMQAKFRLMTSLLDAINTAAAAIKTAVEVIDNGVAGNEFQVDVITLPALAAGTNNIGDVDILSIAAGDNNIGNVDVVTLPALAAGTNHVGAVGASDTLVEITPTLDTSAHTAGDVVVAETEIANAARASGTNTTLMSVMITDKADQKAALTLYFFDRTVTFGTRNSTPSISDADAAYYMGHVDIAAADYDDLGGVSVACAKAIGLTMKPNATSLYVAAMTSGTPTYANGDLVIKFGFLRS